MFINSLVIVTLLISASISLAEGHPFNFFDESFDDFKECLQLNNVTIEEYEKFEEWENVDNLLGETVELKYKCNIKCQLERQPTKWLDDLGKMDLVSMNATSKNAEYITECMEKASDEPCAYAFTLVICAFKSGHSIPDYEYYDDELEAANELSAEEQTTSRKSA
ncbi:general odorant-binding protein 57a [Drosophila biarmipes]|uniref:general odorant-binding protein 57a n=1 Tax=Drosophila biarmipes TaxID=125945 RepID=UPI0007E7A54E|nr:general odorant-binding protein 57a [Drosophila biarmipes]